MKLIEKGVLIPRSQLKPFELPMRIDHDEEANEELQNDIKLHGVENDLIVRDKGDFYEIIDGHRRYAATGQLGWVDETLPCEVREMSDEEAYALSIRLNVLRAEVSPRSLGNYLLYTRVKFGWSQERLAKEIGKTQSWVSRMEKYMHDIANLPIEATERQTRALRAAPEYIRKQIIDNALITGADLPSAQEINDKVDQNLANVLSLLDHTRHDSEYATFIFRTEGGFSDQESEELARKWDLRELGEKASTQPVKIRDPGKSKRARVFSELIKWYPVEIVDIVEEQIKSENVDTLRKWCKIYINEMHKKASIILRQTMLEVFIK